MTAPRRSATGMEGGSGSRADLGTGLACVGAAASVFLAVPLFVVVPVSFGGARTAEFPPSSLSLSPYVRIATDASWRDPLVQSATVALLVATIATVVGILAAYAVQYMRRTARSATCAALVLPLIVSPVVLGVGLLISFARLDLVDTTAGIVLGHLALATPVAFLVGLVAVHRANLRLEAVAHSYGASRVYAFWKLTVPQLRRGIAGAFFLSFETSFDEPVVALFVSGADAKTLPRRLFDAIRYDLDPSAAAVSTALLAVTVLIVWFVARAGSRRRTETEAES